MHGPSLESWFENWGPTSVKVERTSCWDTISDDLSLGTRLVTIECFLSQQSLILWPFAKCCSVFTECSTISLACVQYLFCGLNCWLSTTKKLLPDPFPCVKVGGVWGWWSMWGTLSKYQLYMGALMATQNSYLLVVYCEVLVHLYYIPTTVVNYCSCTRWH